MQTKSVISTATLYYSPFRLSSFSPISEEANTMQIPLASMSILFPALLLEISSLLLTQPTIFTAMTRPRQMNLLR